MITQTQQMSPGKGIASCKKICLKELSDIPVITRLAGCLYKAVAPLIFGAFSCPAQRYFCFLSSFQSTLLYPISPLETQTGAGLLEVACSLTVVRLRKLRALLPAPDSQYTRTFLV